MSTLTRSHVIRNERAADRLRVEVDNGQNGIAVEVFDGRIEVVADLGVGHSIDPDTARLLGTALLSAARVAERA
jgi:hypothetical protein